MKANKAKKWVVICAGATMLSGTMAGTAFAQDTTPTTTPISIEDCSVDGLDLENESVAVVVYPAYTSAEEDYKSLRDLSDGDKETFKRLYASASLLDEITGSEQGANVTELTTALKSIVDSLPEIKEVTPTQDMPSVTEINGNISYINTQLALVQKALDNADHTSFDADEWRATGADSNSINVGEFGTKVQLLPGLASEYGGLDLSPLGCGQDDEGKDPTSTPGTPNTSVVTGNPADYPEKCIVEYLDEEDEDTTITVDPIITDEPTQPTKEPTAMAGEKITDGSTPTITKPTVEPVPMDAGDRTFVVDNDCLDEEMPGEDYPGVSDPNSTSLTRDESDGEDDSDSESPITTSSTPGGVVGIGAGGAEREGFWNGSENYSPSEEFLSGGLSSSFDVEGEEGPTVDTGGEVEKSFLAKVVGFFR